MQKTHLKHYNFSAGPAMLPAEVLSRAQEELTNFQGMGASIMEMSHRGAVFGSVIEKAEATLRTLMQLPEDFKVLFLQGGASSQFSMIPLNLFHKSQKADFIDTGAWSQKAIMEVQRYGKARIVSSSKESDFSFIPECVTNDFDQEAAYVHITTNNTIYGTRFHYIPDTGSVPLVADMSSNILSEPYQVEDFDLIYAGAQKNIGPAGLTIVLIRERLIGHALDICPKMFNYQTHAEKRSMFNTPPTFAIYLAGLVFEWTLQQGGVEALAQRNIQKAELLYDFLDQSSYFRAHIQPPFRSRMNITFSLPNPELNQQFIAAAEEAGLHTLKGHRSVGGMRASLYNPMPLEGVQALVAFMDQFEKKI